jgi:hypothetical protein
MEFKRHALILSVIKKLRARGSWTGKTHLQKALALLADTTDITVPFTFVLYKHGPYSFDVEAELEQMRSYAAVDIQPNSDGYGVTIHPGEMASFVREQAAIEFAEDLALEWVCDLVGTRTVSDLERIATAAWIRRREGIADTRKVAERLHQLKPHVSVADAEAACSELSAVMAGRHSKGLGQDLGTRIH